MDVPWAEEGGCSCRDDQVAANLKGMDVLDFTRDGT